MKENFGKVGKVPEIREERRREGGKKDLTILTEEVLARDELKL